MSRFRTLTLLLALTMLPAATRAATTAHAAKPAKAAPAAGQPAMDPQQMQKMMEMAAAPGPMHDKLKSLEGHWKASVKGFMPESQNEGEADFRMVLGGRYLVEDFKGTYNNAPYNGQGLFGYDNMHKKFFMTWIDDMSTAMMTGTGGVDEAGKAITCTGTIDGMDGKPMKYRSVITFVDDNTHKYEMYATMKDKEMKWIEITYTRAQSAEK
jgi:hypothetical protein